MERYRKFERSCLRACLGRYRSAITDYTHLISNREIYDTANIPRFDIFCLTLTRNYFSSLYDVNNELISQLRVDNQTEVFRMAKSNYSPPEIFTNLDRMGCIQNEHNIPVIYHLNRHCAKKAIHLEYDSGRRDNWVYSTTLPKTDSASVERLCNKYWWLQDDAKYIDEIRRRARRKNSR
ncbi:hypothetical protein KPH14_005221 [Odynerus spinipes]|uniref:Uncharacterized protein n=1 Tax=Odynerus spinipes TaxID=1348599 RepID=A0AAD9VJZ8_9HYME|nr:hypothetical protein KPH14_005221 [Odynerus spinipes]